MEESRWYNSAEEYRAVQGLVREGRYREALERARQTLLEGYLGRKHAARLHSQVCWLCTDKLHQTGPLALLHGEEAVRLASLVRDQWIRSEALYRLVTAYCYVGDVKRARSAFTDLAAEVRDNDAALVGGHASLLQAEALVAAAEDDEPACLSALALSEELADIYPPAIGYRVRLHRLLMLLDYERYAEARPLFESLPAGVAEGTEWALVRAWLYAADGPVDLAVARIQAAMESGLTDGNEAVVVQCLGLQAVVLERANADEARSLVRRAETRAIAAGRIDLVRSLRRRLSRLLR